MSEKRSEGGEEPPALSRLDPGRAAAPEPAGAPPSGPDYSQPFGPARTEPVIDTRRYRWMVGIFGLVLVVVISIYQFATNGVATTGVPPGQRLHYFAAPLANTSLLGDPNLNPPCTLARHDRRALNICLILRHRALVLSFFVTGSGDCVNQVDALQRLSTEFPSREVTFAAVAINAARRDTAALIRAHRWTIPIAYDRDGAVGSIYGVAICPMAELAYRGGIVADRLLGDGYQTARSLAPRVRALLAAGGGRP